ncbi:MAG TPA: hypothetical protein DCD97_04300 [Firmicutes bacterium]|nr:hypothetical protein [Bacillota bacterium]
MLFINFEMGFIIEMRIRQSKRLQQLALELAMEMPFRRAARVLGYRTLCGLLESEVVVKKQLYT